MKRQGKWGPASPGSHLLRNGLSERQQVRNAPPVLQLLGLELVILRSQAQRHLALVVQQHLGVRQGALQLLHLLIPGPQCPAQAVQLRAVRLHRHQALHGVLCVALARGQLLSVKGEQLLGRDGVLLQERVNVLQGRVRPLMVRKRRARGGPAGALQHGERGEVNARAAAPPVGGLA